MTGVDLLRCMHTQSRWFNSGRTIPMLGIVVHSTGANNPNLKRYVQPVKGEPQYWQLMSAIGTNEHGNHWNQPSQPYGMHAWVGKDGNGNVRAVQTLPWSSFLWGCGSGAKGSYNSQYIQFEICEDTTDPAYTRKAYRTAAELCVYLCEEYKIPISKIVSHNEAHKLGYASAHGDPEHWFSLHGYTMDGFRRDVMRLIDGGDWEEVDEVRYDKLEDVPAWAKPTVQKLIAKGALAGTGKSLDLSNDMLRILVINDRMGMYN